MFRKNVDAPDAGEAEDIISKIGADLRSIRTTRGERLEDVAEYLGIKPIYLYGIEQGDLSAIPNQRSKRSYTLSYANYMGLDGDAIMERLLPVIRSLDSPGSPSGFLGISSLDRSSAAMLACSAVSGIVAGWFYLGDTAKLDLIATPVTAGAVAEFADGEAVDDDQLADSGDQAAEDATEEAEQALAVLEDQIENEQQRIAAGSRTDGQNSSNQVAALEEEQASAEVVPKEEIPVNVLATLVAKQGKGAQIYEPENTDARVIVRALNTSWVQVSSEDRSYLWTRTMQPQEMLLVPNREDLELWAGDASGVEILLDGVVLPTLGPPGTVVRGLSLAPASLQEVSRTVSREGSSKPTF